MRVPIFRFIKSSPVGKFKAAKSSAAFFFKSKLMIQLGSAVILFVLVVEAALLVSSVQARKAQLLETRRRLELDVREKTGMSFLDLHPGILNDSDISSHLIDYGVEIAVLSLFVSIFVALGTCVVFYWIVGRHIFRITKLNELVTGRPQFFSEDAIPNNELGIMIIKRNEMLSELRDYQNNIETKLDEAKAQLIQSAKLSMIGEFTAGIIHDINNPLGVILLYSKRLSDGSITPEKRDLLEKCGAAIEKSGEKIRVLVERMGRFSRQDLTMTPGVDVLKVIDNALFFVSSRLQTNNIDVIKDMIIENTPSCFGNAHSLEQVFSNLFANASDAMTGTERRQLSIRTRFDKTHVTVEVHDTGAGIPTKSLSHIFEAFYTTKEIGKGTGLGLSVSHQIIEKHKGELRVKSEVGVGTTFFVTLHRFSADESVGG